MSRTAFSRDDQKDLAKYLATFPSNERTKPSIYVEMAKRFPRHSADAWRDHYRRAGAKIVDSLIDHIKVEQKALDSSSAETSDEEPVKPKASTSKKIPFTDEDDDILLNALVKAAINGRTKASVYQSVVESTGRHTIMSWQTREKDNKEWYQYKVKQRLDLHKARKLKKLEKSKKKSSTPEERIKPRKQPVPRSESVEVEIEKEAEQGEETDSEIEVIVKSPKKVVKEEVDEIDELQEEDEEEVLEVEEVVEAVQEKREPNLVFTEEEKDLIIKRLAICELRDVSKATMYRVLEIKHPQHSLEEWKSEHLANRVQYATLALARSILIEAESAESSEIEENVVKLDKGKGRAVSVEEELVPVKSKPCEESDGIASTTDVSKPEVPIESQPLAESPPTPIATPPRNTTPPRAISPNVSQEFETAAQSFGVGRREDAIPSDRMDEDDIRIDNQLRAASKPAGVIPFITSTETRRRGRSRPLLERELDDSADPSHDWPISTVTQKLLAEAASTIERMENHEDATNAAKVASEKLLREEEVRIRMVEAEKKEELEQNRIQEAKRQELEREQAAIKRAKAVEIARLDSIRLEEEVARKKLEAEIAKIAQLEAVRVAADEKEKKRLEVEKELLAAEVLKKIELAELEKDKKKKKEEAERVKLKEKNRKEKEARQEATRQEAIRVEAARQETIRVEKIRLEAIRVEKIRLEEQSRMKQEKIAAIAKAAQLLAAQSKVQATSNSAKVTESQKPSGSRPRASLDAIARSSTPNSTASTSKLPPTAPAAASNLKRPRESEGANPEPSKKARAAPPPVESSVGPSTDYHQLKEVLDTFAQEFHVTAKQARDLYYGFSAPSNYEVLRRGLIWFTRTSDTKIPKSLPAFIAKRFWSYDEDVIVLEGTAEEKKELEQVIGKNIAARARFLELFKKYKVSDLKRVWPDAAAVQEKKRK